MEESGSYVLALSLVLTVQKYAFQYVKVMAKLAYLPVTKAPQVFFRYKNIRTICVLKGTEYPEHNNKLCKNQHDAFAALFVKCQMIFHLAALWPTISIAELTSFSSLPQH